MTYQLYIKKRNQAGGEIPLDDWLSLVENDAEFSCIINEGDSASAMFQTTGNTEHMTWSDGHINVETPSDKLLAKMVAQADTLDANVVGMTGEVYLESTR